MTATHEGTDNQDIRAVLGQLIVADGIEPDYASLCDDTADAAARMQAFRLDHAHNEDRLEQVLQELADADASRAA